MEEIAAGKGKKRVWHSNRNNDKAVKPRPQSQTEFKAQLRAVANSQAKSGSKAPARRRSGRPPREEEGRAQRPPWRKTAHKIRRLSRAAAKRACPTSCRRASRRCAIMRRAGRIGCTRSSSTVTASRRGSTTARCSCSRARQLDWTRRFEPVADAVAALPATTALLDGELVVEDDKGISNFSLLQTDLKDGRNDRFVYWVFDLLYLDGRDLAQRTFDRAQGGARSVCSKATAEPARSAMPSISMKTAR